MSWQSTVFLFNNLLDPRTSTITENNAAFVSGMGNWSSRIPPITRNLSDVITGDGTWTLTMDLSMTGKKIQGSASVTPDTGRTIQFTVKGAYKSGTEKSQLMLAPADVANKGCNLRVTMTGNAITAIKGKVLGQMINTSL
jgi:hypothetical protein